MGNDIGIAFVSSLIAKNVINEALYGKPVSQKKKPSVKAFFKKIVK